MPELVISQPEFFEAFDKLIDERPLADWITYLRWHVLRARALPAFRSRRGILRVQRQNSAWPGSPGTPLAAFRTSLMEKSAKRSASYLSKSIFRLPLAPA